MNVLSGDVQDGFRYYTSSCIPDSDWANTRVLVQSDQTAMRGPILSGCISSVLRRFPVRAREWQSSDEAALIEVQSLLDAGASRLEGPVAPLVRSAAERIASASKEKWVDI